LPLVPLYAAGLRLQDSFPRTPRRLQWPVLSVGSLSAGGAGKTPAVIALARLLAQHGVHTGVLSRGYGRGSGAIERVDPAGQALRFGDEPLEMARAGLTVYVGADRFLAGSLAEADVAEPHPVESSAPNPAAVHLLDDGFQHRGLHRDLDIVLLTKEDFQDHLLPAGNLREPFRALRRAHIVLLRDNEADSLIPFVAQRTKGTVWTIRRELVLPRDSPQRPLAFCGIARPNSFFAMLRAANCELAGNVAFPDHHPYSSEDIERLCAAAVHAGANSFVTTAKDAVKLTPAFRAALEERGPIVVAELRLTFLNEPAVWNTLRATLHSTSSKT
jgi:tetraacyldisaccharide 4'-kinase